MKRVLIKLGGAALQEQATLELVTQALLEYRRQGVQAILVHGGGPAINEELRLRGIEWSFVGGQRVTTPRMMEAIESTLCGKVNRRVVHALAAAGLNPVGLSAADAQTLSCSQASTELGQVGKIDRVNAAWIEGLLAAPSTIVPVIAPIGAGSRGQRFNVNADWAACHLAVALKVDQLLFMTDQNGILDEEGKLIPVVDGAGIQNMIDAKMVSGGMLTKTLAVLFALNHGVDQVRVLRGLDAKDQAALGQFGTACTLVASPSAEVLNVAL